MADNEKNWEVISKSTGEPMEKELSEKELKEAIDKIFHGIDISTGEAITYWMIMEDYSAGWGFTTKAFYSMDSFGTQIVIPYQGTINTDEHCLSVNEGLEIYSLKIHSDEQWIPDKNGLHKENVTICYSMKRNKKNKYILMKLKEHFSKK